MSIIDITPENFEQLVLQSKFPVLVDFWADWCAPCRMLAPVIDSIAESEESVLIGKINIDKYPQLASRYQVMSIPTLILFHNSRVVHKSVGVLSKSELLSMIKEQLN